MANFKIEDLALERKGSIKIGPFGSQLKKNEFVSSGIKVYDQETTFTNDFNSGNNFISEEKFNYLKSCEIFEGDILVSMMGTIGKTVIVPKNAPRGILNSHLLRIQSNHKIIDSEFLKRSISEAPYVKSQIQNKSHGGIMSGLSASIVKSIKVIVPTIKEQRKITKILWAWDTAIETLEQLIAKKERYKKAMMQKLLTGKVRFKEFKGEKWKFLPLREMVENFIVPMRDKPKDLKGLIPWCRIEDFDGKFLSNSKSGQGVNKKTISEMNLKVYPIGTLLVSCSANLGVCAITESELVTNQTFIGLVPKNGTSVEFLYYQMIFNAKNLNKLSSGTTISYLSREEFENFKIDIPSSKEEQLKISAFLNSIDEELNALNCRRKIYVLQKQGLMQQLLAGKIIVN